MPEAPDSGNRSHDTDPLADTQNSGSEGGEAQASAPGTAKKRVVHAGDVLGRYELIEEIGEGGMATVFRARDRELRREVAIKVLFPHLAKRPEVVRRFHREARAAAGLEHANILRVYDVGGAVNDDDPPYIVMELIRGHSLLGEIEKRGPMLAEVAASIGALLADALAVAHGAGIIHRDVKPANVMIAAGGKLLLADFGVARLETEDSLVTKTGSVLGTPAYMSPEQASGDTATAKSDLYSLGATLYQLATGSLPYSGTPARVIAQIASGSLVPAVRRRADVGPELSRVIDRLMALDPHARPASATEVAAELRAIASASGFGDPSDELAAYFADPDTFVADKRPRIVAALIATAERAIADDKLPRAIALADRAAALAPNDPAVLALVHNVTEGGKASQRRRVLAIIGAGALLAGGAAFGAMQLFGGDDRGGVARDAALVVVGDGDAGGSDDIAGSGGDDIAGSGGDDIAGSGGDDIAGSGRDDIAGSGGGDAGAIVGARADAGALAMTADVGNPRVRTDGGGRVDAGGRTASRRDAGLLVAQVDARTAPVAPIDAGVIVAQSIDAAAPAPLAAIGYLTVKNDTWCELFIDGVARGRIANATKQPLRIEAGDHDVTCEQPGTGKRWSQRVSVAAGATTPVIGALLGTFAVTLEVDALIDGVAHRRGSVAQLRAGRHDLVIGGDKSYFDLRGPCVVRTSPEPGCY